MKKDDENNYSSAELQSLNFLDSESKKQGAKNEQFNVTSHNYSVMNTEKVSQYTSEPREHDNIIKDLLTNARFTGFLLTRVIPEIKNQRRSIV